MFSKLCGWAGLAAAMLGGQLAVAQAPVGYGDWQLHLPTNRPLRLADAGDRLYVVTENSFYFLDKKLNTTQVLSTRDGLSDVNAEVVAYDSVGRQTVVVYKNGNIDVLAANGRVRNLNDVARKSVSGNRAINSVFVDARPAVRRAFISTGFGLVVLNLDRLEISDTYAAIGPNGAGVQVFAATTVRDSLFVSTSQGLQVGRLRDNLLDYNNWKRPTQAPAGAQKLATFKGRVYTVADFNTLYRYAGGAANAWRPVYGYYAVQFRALVPSAAGLLVVDAAGGVRTYDGVTNPGNSAVLLPPGAPADVVTDVVRSADGSFYLANYFTGLQRVPPAAGAARENYAANGPETSRAFGVLADGRSGKVDVFTGGFSDRYQPNYEQLGFYEYAENQWTNFTSKTLPSRTDYPNLVGQVRGARTPDGTLYVASHGGGLLEWKGPGQFRVFDAASGNNPLVSFTGGTTNNVRLTDVAAAADGTVWVAERHVAPGLSGLFHFEPANSTWTQVPYFNNSQSLARLALDNAGQVWVSAARKDGVGAWVVDGTTFANRHFTSADGLPSDELYDLTKDRRGDIWAATLKGVAVFNDPGSAIGGTTGFRQPIVRRGEAAGFPALFTEVVRAVAVDGGNRKWFGTDNGLWLFSEDADEALLHFTTANSPLPSNRIQDVEVNDKTGDVWVATDAGVVSYRSGSSVTEGTASCAQAFPNPVPLDFNGTVGISGVANNALVKITDVAGHLVYAAKTSGGSVLWNLNDVNGRRVNSGVYLVLTSDADGKNGCVTKVAVK